MNVIPDEDPQRAVETADEPEDDYSELMEDGLGAEDGDDDDKLEYEIKNEEEYKQEIFNNIDNNIKQYNNCFFIDSQGGTRKTFLCNTILARVIQERDIAIAVTTTSIASLLLNGGRTDHSKFKIPININKHSVRDIKLQSTFWQK